MFDDLFYDASGFEWRVTLHNIEYGDDGDVTAELTDEQESKLDRRYSYECDATVSADGDSAKINAIGAISGDFGEGYGAEED